jgi:hypothetical protein
MSPKADLLAAEKNKKLKGELEILDPIDAQMEEIVQETHQKVIKLAGISLLKLTIFLT